MEDETLKVAIIGAGQAGLACAHELERHGINPVIYERNSFIGEAFPHIAAILNISHRPIKNSFEYFKNDLFLDLFPVNTINSIVHNSPSKSTTVKGNLGYFFKNSKETDSLKLQLFEKLKNTRIIYNELGDYEKLLPQFDYVVVATGNPKYADELGCWQEWFQAFARGAVVLGDFDPNTLVMWINKDYCKNGYVYLTPFNEKKASIVQIVPNVNEKEIDHYWELFIDTENIKYSIIEEFKLEHKAGFVYPHQMDKLFFIGNAGGGVEPFLGFGHVNALTTGVAAARSIAEGRSYEEQIKPFIDRNIQMRQFRKVFDKMGNKVYDDLIWSIGIPGINQLIYKTPINVSKLGAGASKLVLKD
jgi:digeranylgeranylglycerophospholipid reductase